MESHKFLPQTYKCELEFYCCSYFHFSINGILEFIGKGLKFQLLVMFYDHQHFEL